MSLGDISTISQWIPFLVGITIYWKKGLDKASVIFLLVITVWTISEIINFVYAQYHWNNHLVLNTHWVISTILLIYYFKEVCRLSSNFTWIVILLFLLYSGINLFVFGNLWKWNMPVVYFSSFLILSLSAYSLIIMVNDAVSDLFRKPIFWISSTLLFYFAVALVSFSLFPHGVNAAYSEWINFWSIHSVINIISNLLCTFAFLCRVWTN